MTPRQVPQTLAARLSRRTGFDVALTGTLFRTGSSNGSSDTCVRRDIAPGSLQRAGGSSATTNIAARPELTRSV